LGKTSSATVHALGGTPVALVVNANATAQLGGSGGDQIADAANVQMNGGTFDFNGQNETLGLFTGYGTITNSGAAATLTLGGTANTAGALYATNGTLTLQAGTVTVAGTWNNRFGVAAGGTFNQTGGTVNSGNYFAVGNGTGTGTANMTASGGTFNSAADLLCGFYGPANLTVSGTASLSLNYLAWGDGTTNNVTMALNGGTIALKLINNRGASPGVVNFNGSLLRATATTGSFMVAATNLTANVGTNGALFDSQAFAITISAPLLHGTVAAVDGGVKKVAGTGSLTLTGTNTYTGPTIVSNGVLNTTTASLGAGSYAVTDGATLGVTIASPGQSLAVSSLTLGSAAGPTTNNFTLGTVQPTAPVITNSGALTANGSVVVNVTGTNLTPSTIVLIAYGSSAGSGSYVAGTLPTQYGYTFRLTNNVAAKQLQLVVAATIPDIRWAVGDGTWNTSTANWSLIYGGGSVDYAEADPVTFDDTNSGSSPITVNLDVAHSPFSVTASSLLKSYIFTGAPISGTAALAKSGAGTLTLENTNSFTGGTTISGGTLTLAATSSAGASALVSGVTVNTNGTLQLGGTGGYEIGTNVTVTMAGGTFDMAGATESAFTALNGYGTILDSVGGGSLATLAASTVSGGTLTMGNGTVTYNGILIINNGSTFWQTNGTVNCPAYIYENGQLTVTGGTFGCGLELMPGFQANGTITVGNAGTVDAYVMRVGDVGNGTCYLNPGGTILTDQIQSYGATSLFYLNGGTLGVSARNPARTPAIWFQGLTHAYASTNGAIIDTTHNGGYIHTMLQALEHDPALGTNADGGLVKQGVGTLTLTNGNTYTGPTYVNAGTLAFSANSPITNSSLIGITNGATFDVSALSSAFTLGHSQTLTNNNASTGTLKGSLNTGSGTVALSFAAGTPALYLASGTLTLSSATTVVIDNTGAQLAAGLYPLITNVSTATITGTLPSSVSVIGGGAASSVSLQINGFGLCLVVGNLAPTITSQPVSLTRYAGGTATFTAAVSAYPAAQLHWQLNGVNLSGATNATLVLTNLQLSQAGTYVLTATNIAGGTTSDTVTLTVLPANSCQYLSTILGNNPLGYWRFNDGESTTGYDSVGVINVVDPLAGALGAGPQPTTYPGFESTNTAPVMDGSSQGYASTVSLFNNRSNFTIMGWFNINASTYPYGADYFNHPQARSSLFGQCQAVELGFYGPDTGTNLYFFSRGISHTIFVTNGFAPGVWEYVAVVADATANTTTFYLNGQVVGTASAGIGGASTNANLFSIGKNVTYPTSAESGYDTAYFDGSIDEVAVFDHPLAASAIQAIYNTAAGTAAVAPTNVVASVVNVSGTNSVVITGSGGSGTYSVLTTTNLGLPLASWTVSATGLSFGAGGSLNYTNAASPGTPQRFYLIRVP
jgi:autotransporter-associated beta strand protein